MAELFITDSKGRRRRIFRRKAGGAFHVRIELEGKDILRSLGTKIESVAKEKARQIIEAELKGDQETSRQLKIRSDWPTLRQICDVFIHRFSEGAEKDGDRWIGGDRRKCMTARNYVSALGIIVRRAIGRTLEDSRVNILTAELIEKFDQAQTKLIERDARGFIIAESELSVRTSTQSILGQARSIFSRGALNWYRQLAMPDLTGFKTQRFKRPKARAPERLPQEAIDAINAAAPDLARTNPRCYIAHLLFKFLGMRNIEICAARRSWIERSPATNVNGVAARLAVVSRPDEGFQPKGINRWIPMAPWLVAELDKYWMGSPDGDYLVPAAHKTERDTIVNREHNAWAGQWIKNQSKVSYELRRYAGSLIYQKTGQIHHVQRFLGHADADTTYKWYLYLLADTPALNETDFALPAAEPANVVKFGGQK